MADRNAEKMILLEGFLRSWGVEISRMSAPPPDSQRPLFKPLWIGRAGFGFIWRGIEHQFYRDLDGSMGKSWTHHRFPWTG